MRIRIRHETSYRYAEPANSTLQLLRLTPRPHDGQFIRRWRVTVDANARLERSEDAFGNITHLVFVHGPVENVTITIDGEVDTRDTHGTLRGGVERQPVRLFLRETALTRVTPALRRFARETSAGQGGDQLATVHALTRTLHEAMTFAVGTTHSDTTAADAFEAKSGICQDFTHILLAAARALGLPSRYVSGYYLLTDRTDQEAGHAWAEIYLKGLGWIGFDPANGVCTTDRYVRIAIGCDAREAAPVRGARVGGSGEDLAVAIQVEQGRAMIQEQ
jgi:transglutaminase-like putative cysteine protease